MNDTDLAICTAIAKTHKLTLRQVEELESISHIRGACNFAGSAHSVLEKLAEKGLVSYNPNKSPQWRGYRITEAGSKVLEPLKAEQARRRAEYDRQEDERREAANREYARHALKLDGSGYESNESIEAEVRRELGLDKLFAAAGVNPQSKE